MDIRGLAYLNEIYRVIVDKLNRYLKSRELNYFDLKKCLLCKNNPKSQSIIRRLILKDSGFENTLNKVLGQKQTKVSIYTRMLCQDENHCSCGGSMRS